MFKGNLLVGEKPHFLQQHYWGLCLLLAMVLILGPHAIIGIPLLLLTVKAELKCPRQRYTLFDLKTICKMVVVLTWKSYVNEVLISMDENNIINKIDWCIFLSWGLGDVPWSESRASTIWLWRWLWNPEISIVIRAKLITFSGSFASVQYFSNIAPYNSM